MHPTYPLVPILNLLSCILVCIPLLSTSILSGPWNTFVLVFALSNAVGCLQVGINSIIWSDNVNDVASVWCDISMLHSLIKYYSRYNLYYYTNGLGTHFAVMYNNMIRACNFRMTRSIYNIALCKQITDNQSVRSRDLIVI